MSQCHNQAEHMSCPLSPNTSTPTLPSPNPSPPLVKRCLGIVPQRHLDKAQHMSCPACQLPPLGETSSAQRTHNQVPGLTLQGPAATFRKR